MEESVGNCPVCRKSFLAKDFDHVLALVDSYSSQLVSYLLHSTTWIVFVNENFIIGLYLFVYNGLEFNDRPSCKGNTCNLIELF